MATATAKKSSSSSSAKKKSSSSSRQPTAKGSVSTKKDAASPEAKHVEAIRQKRADYDQPVVDAPVPVYDLSEEIFDVEGKALQIVGGGDTVELAGHTFDREGILALSRVFSKAGAAL